MYVNYIGYFYYVFPLHLNSFNRLFSEVINPKLLKLISSVSKFTGLTNDIDTLIKSLNGVFSYLQKYNPAEKLLELIKSFNGDDYALNVKSHIGLLIDKLNGLNVKSKYQEIIGHVQSLARQYNLNLEGEYKSFKAKIEQHKASLEQNIQQYIQKIKKSLEEHSSFVDKLYKTISQDIKNLETNHGNLGQFNYEKKHELMKTSQQRPGNGSRTQLNDQDMKKLEEIVKAHKEYKQCLEKCSEITSKLNQLKGILIYYNSWIKYTRNSLYKYNDSVNDYSNIEDGIFVLEVTKSHLDKFEEYKKCLQKLEEIGKQISIMKDALNGIEDKVEDKAKTYIEKLASITITHSDIESRIKNIKSVNESVIARLEITKKAIEFNQKLKDEIEKLTHTFYYHNNIDFLKQDFSTVKGKVTSFDTAIKSKLCSVMAEINKFKEKSQEATTAGGTCVTKKLEQGNDDLISPVLHCIDGTLKEIPNIIKLIDESLEDIKMIKHMIKVLEYNKNQSGKISEIKSKVTGISNLIDAKTKLPEAVKELDKFVDLQENTKFWIDQFSSHGQFRTLGGYSKPLQDTIDYSKMVIAHVNYYIGYLKTVGDVDSVITGIKCYIPWFETINKIIQNFNPNVIQIIPRLETINLNLCQLKSVISSCCPGYFVETRNSDCSSPNENKISNYNLSKLKDYMRYLKFYVRNIRENFNVISAVIGKIKNESSDFSIYKLNLESLVSEIECYIDWIRCSNNDDGLIESVVKRLEEIKDRLNDTIIIIKYIIEFHTHPVCIKSIGSKLICVESSVNKLECAIEGVPRNFIRCSLLSSNTNTTNKEINDNNINNN